MMPSAGAARLSEATDLASNTEFPEWLGNRHGTALVLKIFENRQHCPGAFCNSSFLSARTSRSLCDGLPDCCFCSARSVSTLVVAALHAVSTSKKLAPDLVRSLASQSR
jgi:hypothetical protein